jgi:mannitol/fructose-specific phosphotransferase system IIA component (Ntr-type)
MTLADFTTPGLIVSHLGGQDATGAIHELSLALQREGCVPDWLPFYHEALNREFLLSTGMEAGMAFPHARLPGVKKLAFAFGRADEPFAWSPRNTQFVRLIFLLAVPTTDPENYLPLISALARLSGNHLFMDSVNDSADSAGIVAVFREVVLRGSPMPATQA